MGIKRWNWGYHGMEPNTAGSYVKWEDHVKSQPVPPDKDELAAAREENAQLSKQCLTLKMEVGRLRAAAAKKAKTVVAE